MNDIKKVLAYSTISQLGFMMLALGVGSWVAAVFHLMTHAFFKALLFLAAGSVIHGTHTQDMREMGGLWRKMPWTTGDLGHRRAVARRHPPARRVLEQGRDPARGAALGQDRVPGRRARGRRLSRPSTWAARRSWRSSAKPGPRSKSEHAHESPWVMTAPLVILATLAVAAGLVGSPLGRLRVRQVPGRARCGRVQPASWRAIAVGAALAGIGYAWLDVSARQGQARLVPAQSKHVAFPSPGSSGSTTSTRRRSSSRHLRCRRCSAASTADGRSTASSGRSAGWAVRQHPPRAVRPQRRRRCGGRSRQRGRRRRPRGHAASRPATSRPTCCSSLHPSSSSCWCSRDERRPCALYHRARPDRRRRC